MENLLRQINSRDVDSTTLKLIRHFAEVKLEAVRKINARIARDLNKLGKYACLDPSAYDKLRDKYLRAHKGRQWLELLDIMKKQNCKGDLQHG